MSRKSLIILGGAVIACFLFSIGQANSGVSGKQPPKSKLESPDYRALYEGTSFEEIVAGTFDSLDTQVGVWQRTAGTVLIDHQHAKTGDQCLQIAGGDASVVELKLADHVKTDGQLSFWAERWTSREPFSFRIEKLSNGKWSEIFNGDQQVRVGRAFLSNVKIPLADPGIERLRFSVTSPPGTGVLIDDLRFSPALPQRVTDVQQVPMTLPALVGAKASALLKLKIETEGTLRPISLTSLSMSLADIKAINGIDSFQVYYTGSDSNFNVNSQFGEKIETPNPKQTRFKIFDFKGEQTLLEGDNYFWIACTLNQNADINGSISVVCSPLGFSDGTSKKLNYKVSTQRFGVAVRSGGDDGVHTYRIPGLATTNQGTLIGVYDVRYTGGGDLPGNIDVGMSRSTDGGQTWEPMKIIMDMGNDPQFRFDGIGDPTVMVDKTTGTIWCSATWSHGNRSWNGSQPGLEPVDTGQFILVKSDDDGQTWSEPINITKQVKKPEWSFLLQGPGKGITMSDGTLVIPAQYQDPPNANDRRANRLPHSTFIFSRDHGENWQVATGAYDDTTEAQVVELDNGELMINCRYNREGKRVVMTTDDMGKTWKEHPTNRLALIEPGSCMASLINVGRELGRDKTDWLLFSNPNNSRQRSHMTIKASPDSGNTWPEKHQLLLDEQRSAGYSCMSMIDDETVGILYEGSQAQMTFQRIKLKDIINGNPNAAENPNAATKPNTKSEPHSLSFGRVFGDHMVLQANKPVRVWGVAKPDTEVLASLGSFEAKTKSDRNGKWQVEFPAQRRSSESCQLTAIAGAEKVTIQDVLIGEVWFCAGQSNMEWPVSKSEGAAEALEYANDPSLRLMNFAGAARGGSGIYGPQLMSKLIPEVFCQGRWKVADRNSAKEFSAVGFYFAKRLREQLNCPVGVINVSIGGTPIEAWTSIESLASDSELSKMLNGNWLENPVLDQWCRTRAKLNLKRGLRSNVAISDALIPPGDKYGPNHSFKPGFMFEAAVKPFAPMTISGVLWYQGESNGDSRARINQYHRAFPIFVNDWRKSFGNETLPFCSVQLPAMDRPNWPIFREYQRRSIEQLSGVGMVVTIDTGHPTDVHPKDKTTVGQRLAQWALVSCYDGKGPETGPLFWKKKIAGDQMTLSFLSTRVGMKTTDKQPPRHFELAGSDGVFHAAQATIDRNKIVLYCSDVRNPVHARYAWSPYPNPKPNVVNEFGLPMSPFTTEEEF